MGDLDLGRGRSDHADKLWLKKCVAAWKNPTTRAYWHLCGEMPKGCELSRLQLQGVFGEDALATTAVTEQTHSLAGFDVLSFMPRGADPEGAGSLDIHQQFGVLAKVILLVVGSGITSAAGIARVAELRTAFDRGVDLVAKHVEAQHEAIRMREHKERIARFINKDLEDWSNAVHNGAFSANSQWHEPPGIDDLSAVVVPTWAKIRAFINAGGLANVEVHRSPSPRGENEERGRKRAHSDMVASRSKCRAWAGKRGCRFEIKGLSCKYKHDPAFKYRGDNQSGNSGSSGLGGRKKRRTGTGGALAAAAPRDTGGGQTRGGSSR